MQESNRLAPFLRLTMPLATLALICLAILQIPNDSLRGIEIEAGSVISVVWFLTREPINGLSKPRQYRGRFWNSLSLVFILFALLSLFTTNDYARPLSFFVFVAGFYSAMFMEVFYGPSPSRSFFTLKLIIGQFIFIESFAFLYPGFVAADPYRDLGISQSIVVNSGGLPRDFVPLVWYDFSPIAPLAYALASIVSTVPVQTVELLLAYSFSFGTMVAMGLVSRKLIQDASVERLVLLLGSMAAYLWVWATWPIPEMLALFLASLFLYVFAKSQKATFSSVLLLVAVVLTHGVIAIILIMLMFFVYLATRKRGALYLGGVGVLFFLIYSVYATAKGTPYGLISVVNAIEAVLSPSSFVPSTPSLGQGGIIGAIQTLAGTFWWVFLFALGFAGLSLLVRNRSPGKNFLAGLVIAGFVFFAVGLAATVAASQSDLIRYAQLPAYPLLLIPAAVSLNRIFKTRRRTTLLIPVLLALLIFSAVASPINSPDLWHSVGQPRYAGLNRLQYSTTFDELASQNYVSVHDMVYYVQGNYLLEYINLSTPGSLRPLPLSPLSVGYTLVPVDGPHITLISNRALELGFPNPTSTAAPTQSNSIVYSNGNSYAILVGQ